MFPVGIGLRSIWQLPEACGGHQLFNLLYASVAATSEKETTWTEVCVSIDRTAPQREDSYQKSGIPRDEYSDTSLRNMEDLSSNNRAGVSYSATRPAKHSNIPQGLVKRIQYGESKEKD